MSKTAEIDLSKDAVLIIKDGQKIELEPRAHGVDEIIWRNNVVLDVIKSERVRLDGQSKI